MSSTDEIRQMEERLRQLEAELEAEEREAAEALSADWPRSRCPHCGTTEGILQARISGYDNWSCIACRAYWLAISPPGRHIYEGVVHSSPCVEVAL